MQKEARFTGPWLVREPCTRVSRSRSLLSWRDAEQWAIRRVVRKVSRGLSQAVRAAVRWKDARFSQRRELPAPQAALAGSPLVRTRYEDRDRSNQCL